MAKIDELKNILTNFKDVNDSELFTSFLYGLSYNLEYIERDLYDNLSKLFTSNGDN